MKKTPNMLFVIDTNVESLAIKEGIKLNIPIVAIVDTNSDPTGINYPIPGNDDARRAINLYCELIKKTILDASTNIRTEEKVNGEIKSEEKIESKNNLEVIKKEVPKKKEKKDKKTEKKSSSILSCSSCDGSS